MIKLQYKDLANVAEFLMKLSLKGKKSVHRMRLVKAIQEQNKKVGEDELELLKEYVETDDDGGLATNKQGGFKYKEGANLKEFKNQQNELFDEYFVIDDKNLETALNTVKEIVNDYNKELSDKDAEAHFILVDAFEQSEGDEE